MLSNILVNIGFGKEHNLNLVKIKPCTNAQLFKTIIVWYPLTLQHNLCVIYLIYNAEHSSVDQK